MKEDMNDIQLIEKYLGGNMTEEEQKLFDDKRIKDEAFNGMLKDMDLLVEGIKQSAAQTSKEEKIERLKFFADIMGDEERSEREDSGDQRAKVVPLHRNGWSWAIAASIAVASISFLLWNQSADPSKLYTESFVPYPNVFEPTVRGVEPGSDKRATAFRAYENANYVLAASLFGELLQTKNEPGILLLLGNSNLILGKYEEAAGNFNTLIDNFDDLDMQAKWFLSLTYMKTGKMDEARAILNELGKTDVSYKSKANELLKKLD